MKKLLLTLGTILVVLGVMLVANPVQATQQDSCNQEFVYEKTSDYSDNRVAINFESNDHQIDVSAGSGYAVIKVLLDISDDGQSGYVQHATGPLNNYNPSGDEINEAKVTVKKVCVTPTPTNSPSPTPTATITPTVIPTVSPTPTEDPCQPQEYSLLRIAIDEGPYPQDPCVTPTPEVTPEVTPTPCTGNCGGWSPRPEGEKSTTQAPVCTNGEVVRQPANAHVARYGDKADTNFFITEGDSAHVYWRVVGTSMWIASSAAEYPEGVKPNGDRYVSYTAKNLDPNLGYEFGIQQKNGCGGGAVYVVVDGPAKTIFREWYWEIN